MTQENIDKAVATSDMLTWGIMFSVLVIVAIGLAIWDKKYKENLNEK